MRKLPQTVLAVARVAGGLGEAQGLQQSGQEEEEFHAGHPLPQTAAPAQGKGRHLLRQPAGQLAAGLQEPVRSEDVRVSPQLLVLVDGVQVDQHHCACRDVVAAQRRVPCRLVRRGEGQHGSVAKDFEYSGLHERKVLAVGQGGLPGVAQDAVDLSDDVLLQLGPGGQQLYGPHQAGGHGVCATAQNVVQTAHQLCLVQT